MEYKEFNYSDKLELEKLLSSPNKETKIGAIIGMVNGVDDWVWVQEKLLEFIHDDDFWIAKNAIMGLADIARIHRNLDLDKVERALNEIKNKDLEGIINSVKDDIEIYIKKS